MLNQVGLTKNATIGNKFVEIRVDAEQTLECYQNWEGDYEIRVDTLQALEYYRQSGEGDCEVCAFMPQQRSKLNIQIRNSLNGLRS